MTPDKTKSVSFSGHRSFKMEDGEATLFGGDALSAEEIGERLRNILSVLIDKGYANFLCGMAEGFDLLAGAAVLELKGEYPHIMLTAVIPWPGQARYFDRDTKEAYDCILAAAGETIVVCDRYSPDCFHRRNDYLIDNSTVLVCFYNGTKGGTAYTVKRAVKQGLRIVNIL